MRSADGAARGAMMQAKPGPQQVVIAGARAAPAEPARASPVLQKNIVAMPQGGSAMFVQPAAAQQKATSCTDQALEALADKLTSLAVAKDSATASQTTQLPPGGNVAETVTDAAARSSAAARDPAGRTEADATKAAAREKARAEAAAARKRRKAEQAQAKRDAAAAAAAALTTLLSSVPPDEARLLALNAGHLVASCCVKTGW